MNTKAKDFFLAVMLGGFVLICVVLVYGITHNPKTVATADSVWSVLENNGYEPIDSTQEYKDQWADNSGRVSKAVTAIDGDINFNFFVFSDDEMAEKARGEYMSYIRWHRYDAVNVETGKYASNYSIYTIEADGMYSVDIRIGNTVIFAYSDAENADKINKIISEIEYF